MPEHACGNIIAGLRDKANTLAIFVLNFLLGWTFIGWVVALVWSMTAEQDFLQRYS